MKDQIDNLTDEQAADLLRNLGFEVRERDTTKPVWYWKLANGNVSPAADEMRHIYGLKAQYPDTYAGAELKHDTGWYGDE